MFQDCCWLTNVKIPNTVTEIQWGAFSGCWRLENINIPNSVTKIGVGAFHDCKALPSRIVEQINWIIDNAFEKLKSLW